MSSERDGQEVFGATRTIKDAKGSSLTVKPLGLSDFASAREESLDFYRREQIKAWTSNADLMPEDSRKEWIREAFEKAAQISYEDLPEKQVIEYEDDEHSASIPKDERIIKAVHHVEYAMWWISSEFKGMLFALWLSARKAHPELTIEEIEQRFMSGEGVDETALNAAAQKVGKLSQAKIVGNGEAPDQPGRKRRKKRKRQTTGH